MAVFIKLETKKITSNRDDLFRMNFKLKRIIISKTSSLQSQEQFSKYAYLSRNQFQLEFPDYGLVHLRSHAVKMDKHVVLCPWKKYGGYASSVSW